MSFTDSLRISAAKFCALPTPVPFSWAVALDRETARQAALHDLDQGNLWAAECAAERLVKFGYIEDLPKAAERIWGILEHLDGAEFSFEYRNLAKILIKIGRPAIPVLVDFLNSERKLGLDKLAVEIITLILQKNENPGSDALYLVRNLFTEYFPYKDDLLKALRTSSSSEVVDALGEEMEHGIPASRTACFEGLAAIANGEARTLRFHADSTEPELRIYLRVLVEIIYHSPDEADLEDDIDRAMQGSCNLSVAQLLLEAARDPNPNIAFRALHMLSIYPGANIPERNEILLAHALGVDPKLSKKAILSFKPEDVPAELVPRLQEIFYAGEDWEKGLVIERLVKYAAILPRDFLFEVLFFAHLGSGGPNEEEKSLLTAHPDMAILMDFLNSSIAPKDFLENHSFQKTMGIVLELIEVLKRKPIDTANLAMRKMVKNSYIRITAQAKSGKSIVALGDGVLSQGTLPKPGQLFRARRVMFA